MPTNINFGKDCLRGLSGAIKNYPVKRIIIFTGRKSAQISGALDEVKNNLSGYSLIVFTGIKPNPTIESLKEGIGLCRDKGADLIIAVGGGSVIDYAKAVSVLSKKEGDLYDFFYKKRRPGGARIKFIAIPTTFGTSSEITPFAVMTDEGRKTKITLSDNSMFPDYAFTDAKFTLTMPGPLVASSCADLLAHAIEAYWNVNATALTDNYAASALKLFLSYYRRCWRDPEDLEAREGLSLAGIYAGLAFSNTKTTASHSISYPLTIIFNIPHGIACALSLAEMLEFNAKGARGKILKLCAILGAKSPKEAKKRINAVLSNLKIKSRLRDYGLARGDLKIVIDKGFTAEKMLNNPRKVTKSDLQKILEAIY